jgi:hypothetical protein
MLPTAQMSLDAIAPAFLTIPLTLRANLAI